jgi:PAS domain S-box-containing protein
MRKRRNQKKSVSSRLSKQKEKLKDMSEYYKIVNDFADDYIFIVGDDMRVLYANRASAKELKLSKRRIIGKKLKGFLEGKTENELREDIKRVLSDNETFRDEDWVRILRGRIWVETKLIPIKHINGRPTAVLVIARDTTEKKKAQEKAEESARQFKAIVENAPDSIEKLDKNLKYVYVNKQTEKETGIPAKKFIGNTAKSLGMPAKVVNKWSGALKDVFNRGRSKTVEIEYPTPRGKRTFQNIIVPEFGYSGEIKSVFSITRNISNLKRIQRQLSDSQRQIYTLVNNLPGFVYRCANNKDWTMEYISKGVKSVLGYAPEDIINDNKISYNQIIHKDDRKLVWDKVQSGVKHRQLYKIIYRVKAKRGGIKWVWEQGRAVFSKDGKVDALEGLIMDITELKEVQNELSLSEERYELAERAANIGTWEMRIDKGDVNWSENIEGIIGLKNKRLHHSYNAFMEYVHPADKKSYKKAIKSSVKTGKSHSVDFRIVRPDKTVRWVHGSWGVIKDNKTNKPVRMLGAIIDITQRKKVEE